jgi:hypothetical protein
MTNLRDDAYGGFSVESRTRFLFEVLAAVRRAVGTDFPLGVRLSSEEQLEGGHSAADVHEIASLVESSGLCDFLNVSWGSYYMMDKFYMDGAASPHGYMVPIVERTTREASLPTIVTGRVTTVAEAAHIIDSGAADMVSMVRALLADPDLVLKTLSGSPERVRPCIGCNQACTGGLRTRGHTQCTVNVGAGKETVLGDSQIRRAVTPQRVVVVGGGPCGMEAARVGALAGHEVTLLEAARHLGGQWALLAKTPNRVEMAGLIDFYEAELDALGVEMKTNVSATAAMLGHLAPDAIVVATGSVPRRDCFQSFRPALKIEGLPELEVLTSWDVLNGAATGRSVALLDDVSHFEAIDVAELLIGRGCTVHFITRYAVPCSRAEMRYDTGVRPHLELLRKGDFVLHGRSLLVGGDQGHIGIASSEARHDIELLDVDSLVYIGGNISMSSLAEDLAGAKARVVVAGDALSPRFLEPAITEGQLAIRSLDPNWVSPRISYGWSGAALALA